MCDKLFDIFMAVVGVFCVLCVLCIVWLPFVLYADIKARGQFEAACAAKGGTAVELQYDRICLPADAAIPVGVE